MLPPVGGVLHVSAQPASAAKLLNHCTNSSHVSVSCCLVPCTDTHLLAVRRILPQKWRGPGEQTRDAPQPQATLTHAQTEYNLISTIAFIFHFGIKYKLSGWLTQIIDI
jgi:hypothetical protein